MRFFLIHSKHLPGHGTRVVFRPRAAAVNNNDIGKTHLLAVTYEIFLIHSKHLPGHGTRVVFRTRAAAVNNNDIGKTHLLAVTYEIFPFMIVL